MRLAAVLIILFLGSLLCVIAVDGVAASTDNGLATYWQSTGTSHVDIGESGQKLMINITQLGSASSMFNVTLSSNNGKVTFYPTNSINTLLVEPNSTITESFFVNNTGGYDKTENVPVTITVTDIFTQQSIGSETVYATLLATLSHESAQPTQTQPTETPLYHQNVNTVDWVWIVIILIVVIVIVTLVLILRKRKK